MRRIISFLSLILIPCSLLLAQANFDAANAAYAEGRYAEAAAGYEALIAETPDATLYYNLGNTRFKQGELAQAILNYERALRLRPNYKDAQYNLAFAQSRITDNIVEQDFFLSAWEAGIQVLVVGIGKPEGSPIPMPGTNNFRKDREGNVVVSKLNEEMCREIAKAGGGIYVHCDNTNTATKAIQKELDKLATQEIETQGSLLRAENMT